MLNFLKRHYKMVIFLIVLAFLFMPMPKQRPNLVEIPLNGAILDDKEILNKIYSAKNDPSIKGVLLNINSPGGAVSPSFEISMAIKNLRKLKPVIAYASGTMASGSYLSGVWANKILSNPASFIGSIGVIIQGINAQDLANKIGISPQVIKAGEYKEAGTIMRPWNEMEKTELQNLVNKTYNLFTTEVAKARKLDINNTNSWANARVFLANDAKKLGLIDEISDYESAKNLTIKLSGVEIPIWQEEDKINSFLKNFMQSNMKYLADVIFMKLNINTL